MACPGVGPCETWPLVLDCLDGDENLVQPCISGTPVSPTIIDNSVLVASQIVWALTGRQFSECNVKIRPCRQACDDGSFRSIVLPWENGNPIPALIGGEWYNLTCGCGNTCFCNDTCEIAVPYPTCEVSEVKIDGVALDTSAYMVTGDRRRLRRIDGECWPTCNKSLPDTEVGTWSVTLTYGVAIPQLVLDAASEIACELIKARVGQECSLPRQLVRIVRSGSVIEYENPQRFWKEGRTGFYMLDLAIKAYNPNNLMRKAAIYSVDSDRWQTD